MKPFFSFFFNDGNLKARFKARFYIEFCKKLNIESIKLSRNDFYFFFKKMEQSSPHQYGQKMYRTVRYKIIGHV